MSGQKLPGGMQRRAQGAGYMTAIERVGRSTAVRFGGGPSAAGASGFTLPADPAAASHAPSAAVPVASLTSMLTLQELSDETAEDRSARRHGQDMLTLLARIQRALLAGRNDAATLAQLADLAGAVPRATDRRLAAMVSAIVVRVRVELARRQL
jgi:hypothetical protein